MKIFSLEQIKESINISKDLEELINSQKAAFMDYSADLYREDGIAWKDEWEKSPYKIHVLHKTAAPLVPEMSRVRAKL